MALDTDTEEPLSPAEFSQLKSVFDLCDKDSDGLLTVNEFRTLCHQFLGLGTSTRQVEKLLKELDPDETGVIDFDNFTRGIQSYISTRRDSSSSSLSGSCLSLNGFGDEPGLLTSSPTGGNLGSVADETHPPLIRTSSPTAADSKDSSSRRNLSYQYQFNNNNASELDFELTANGTDEEEGIVIPEEPKRRLLPTDSLSTLDVQPSGISPTLMARSLSKKNSHHNFLNVSSGMGGTGVGSASYDSTPDWTIDDDHDELTDKLQELSTRLEGLEVDLDSSQTQTLHLRKENLSLRDRIDQYEETLRELQVEKEAKEKQAAELLKQTKAQLKRKHEEELDELREELHETQERIRQLEISNEMLQASWDESQQECETRRDESSRLRLNIADLEDNMKRLRDHLMAEKEKWNKQLLGSQQEIEAMSHVIEHLRKELEDGKISKKRNAVTTSDLKNSEIAGLKKEIKSLQEANDRLSSQLLQQGKKLVAEQPRSLLEELEDAPKNEIMKALKEQEQYNERLKMYIEGLLVTIIEKHPELLEVKS